MADNITIKQLTEVNGDNIAPYTPESAVYDTDGNTLDTKLEALGMLRTDSSGEFLCNVVDKEGYRLLSISDTGEVRINNELVSESGYTLKSTDEYTMACVDNDGNVLYGVDSSGSMVADSMTVNRLNVNGLYDINVISNDNYIIICIDSKGKVLFGVLSDGSFVVSSIVADNVTKLADRITALEERVAELEGKLGD